MKNRTLLLILLVFVVNNVFSQKEKALKRPNNYIKPLVHIEKEEYIVESESQRRR